MPFDGSGNYTPAAAPNFPAVGGTVINSSYYNTVINDIAAGLTNCLTRDGQGKPTADINWNAKSLTNVNNFGAVTATFSGALSATSGSFNGGLTLTSGNGIAVTSGTTGSLYMSGGTTFNTDGASIAFRGSTSAFNPWGLELYAGGSERIRLTSNGNLGIGNTSPGYKLDVGTFSSGAGNNIRIQSGSDSDLRLREANDSYGFTIRNVAASGLSILRHSNDATGVSALYIGRDTGNVGIGTSSPTNTLHIEKTGGSIARFRDATSGADTYLLSDSGGTALIQTQTLPLKLSTSNTTRLHIDAGGNVGIGTTSPVRKFVVQDNFAYIGLNTPSTTNKRTGIAFSQNGVDQYEIGIDLGNSNARNWYIYDAVATTTRILVDTNGNVGVGTNSPTQKLHVAGNVLVSPAAGWSAGQTSFIYLGDTNNTLKAAFGGALELQAYNGINLTVNSGTYAVSFSNSGAITSPSLADAVGYKGLPQTGTDSSYTLVLTDQGKDIYLTGSTAGQTITIPTNASVAFPVGTVIKISNDSNQNWTLASAGDTMVQKITGSTTSRTIPPQCDAVIEKKSATRWWVSGAGLL